MSKPKAESKFRVLKPDVVKVGNRALGGQVLTESELKGKDIPSLIEQGALEPIDAPPAPSGG
jgi:hypothetical protein